MIPKFCFQIFSLLVLVIMIHIPASARAEFYSYRDESGVLRFTDDMMEVPETSDHSVRLYRESSESKMGSIKDETDSNPQVTPGSGGIVFETRAYSMHMTLNRQKASLKSEYDELIAVQQKLKAEAENVHTMSEMRIYNEKASDLNRKIQNFEEKRHAYEAKLNAFLQGN